MQDGSVSPVRNFFRNKWVRLILLVDIIIIIFIVINLIIEARKTSVIEFNVVPSNSQILVNGRSYVNGSYHIAPGIYNIEISHEDLDTKNFTIDLEKQDIATITTFLHQDDNFDFYQLRDNLDAFSALSEIASAGYNQTTDQDTSAEAFIINFEEAYNLYSTALPVTYSEYNEDNKLTKYISVRASYDCVATLCLKTTIYDENDKSIVKRILTDAGFNLEDFEIEYQIY